MQIARIFGVNRLTVYNWEGNGLPLRPPERPGRPAKIDFEEALDWYIEWEENRGVSEDGLKILEESVRSRKERYYGRKS
jgi:transposase